ncbi:MAG: histidine phosphatase family protein [Minwuia sp.]|nr:histidine phosphatase family protein [Minwuia sp.]
MKRLLLLRHAKAAPPAPGQGDHDRILDAQGKQATPVMAHFMARNGMTPDLVLCSDAARTRETWDLVAAENGWNDIEQRFLETLYLAEASRICQLIQREAGAAETILLVGHNPGIEELAGLLTDRNDKASRRDLAAGMATATLVAFILPGPWSELHQGNCKVDAIARPSRLGAG